MICLTGLGSDYFENCSKATSVLRDILGSQLADNVLQEWVPRIEHDFTTLEFTNRYHTSSSQAGGKSSVAYEKFVDPKGVLKKLAQDLGAVHLDENQVQYLERTVVKSGSTE